jgi:CPA2 family monovalent cation:H+ antiporter-2
VEERQQARLMSVTLPVAAACLGKPLGDLALHAMGVLVVSVRQASGRVVEVDDAIRLHTGDTLVLSGLPEALALAEEKLLKRG